MKKKFQIILPYLTVILSAFLYSYAVRSFINKAGLLVGGFSGISLVLARYSGIIIYQTNLDLLLANQEWMSLVNTLTSIFFFVFNIPLIVLAFSKLGKRFAILSTVYITFNTLFIKIIPTSIINIFDLGDNILSYALFAGVLCGSAIGLALNAGGSTGGMEIIATYYSRRKQMAIGKFSIIINTIIIVFGGIVFQQWTPILYTLVLVFTSGRVVDTIHRFTKRVIINVVSAKSQEITASISQKTHYSSTIVEGKGGYSNEPLSLIMIVVPEYKADYLVEIIQEIDIQAFITVSDSNAVYGNFYIEPLK